MVRYLRQEYVLDHDNTLHYVSRHLMTVGNVSPDRMYEINTVSMTLLGNIKHLGYQKVPSLLCPQRTNKEKSRVWFPFVHFLRLSSLVLNYPSFIGLCRSKVDIKGPS